jgi:opacity protein-like surface antigen
MLKRVIPAAIALALVSGACAAQTEGLKKGFFIGGGINTIDTDTDLPEPDNYFLQLGYGFSENWSAELQYSDSYKDGSFSEESSIYVPELNAVLDVDVDGDVSFKTTSIFLAYRSTGNFYWKAKAGFMDAEATVSASGSTVYEGETIRESSSESASESGWAAGAGLGYSFGSSSIELEYVTSDDKISIDSIALGYNYWF